MSTPVTHYHAEGEMRWCYTDTAAWLVRHQTEVTEPPLFTHAELYAMLVKPAYMTELTQAEREAQRNRLDVTPWEVSGPGYTAGGTLVTNPRWERLTYGWTLHSDPVVWPNATLCARAVLVYLNCNPDGEASEDDILIGGHDFGTDVCVSLGTFTITPDEDGLLVVLDAFGQEVR